MSAFPGSPYDYSLAPRRRGPVYTGAAPYAGGSDTVTAPFTPHINRLGAGPIAAPSVDNVPYLPPGYQAPSPNYIDQTNRMAERSDDRQRRNDNFYRSVQTNNARDQQFAQQSAGTFAASKTMGQTDSQARRSAYLATHGAPYVPGPYGQTMQAPPTIVAPVYSGSSRGAAPAAPIVAPYGTNVTGGNTAAMGQKAFNPVDHSTIVKNLTGRPITNLKGEITGYNGLSPQDAEAQAQKDLAGGPMAATTQPSQPQYPTTPQNDPSVSEFPANTKNRIGVTTQQARAMVGAVRQSYPGMSENDVAHIVRGRLVNDYGVKDADVNRLFGPELEKGHIQSEQTQAQVNPGVRVPLSMLGASNGNDPNVNFGAPRQAVPGPSVGTPATGRDVTGPVQGHTPMTLDEGTAAKLLQQAGGNKEYARTLARIQGYAF